MKKAPIVIIIGIDMPIKEIITSSPCITVLFKIWLFDVTGIESVTAP
jgi:hypothetical protein